MKAALYALRMPQLLPDLKGKDFMLSNLGEVKVGDKPALGIGLSHKDHKDVNLFFDKETGLPAKSEVRITDPNGKELTIEYLYSDYKESDGVKNPMKIAISKFKATCLSVLENVNKTGRPVRVTRFGKPVAEIVPCAPQKDSANWLGSMSGTMEITGDIVGSSTELTEWNALRD